MKKTRRLLYAVLASAVSAWGTFSLNAAGPPTFNAPKLIDAGGLSAAGESRVELFLILDVSLRIVG
jgi:hypothetical protein